jgi:hypothetical protein
VTKLSEMPFKSIQVGMKFYHSSYGEQVVLDLDRNSFGPLIRFHNCDIYSGKLPVISSEDEDIFQLLAKTTFPCGADQWEYVGILSDEAMASNGWRWFEVACPHCGAVHRLLAQQALAGQRQCLVCGMLHARPLQSASSS